MSLFKKLEQIRIFFSSNDDPRDIVRGVKVLKAFDRELTDRVEDFHEERIKKWKNAIYCECYRLST